MFRRHYDRVRLRRPAQFDLAAGLLAVGLATLVSLSRRTITPRTFGIAHPRRQADNTFLPRGACDGLLPMASPEVVDAGVIPVRYEIPGLMVGSRVPLQRRDPRLFGARVEKRAQVGERLRIARITSDLASA